ncbi:MAG: 3-methyladenine DNA glycosylase [Propionibacteriales bacterium]|nr:3-methyladenine DNA glycosylase [Propionibacteriales bacterium]
MERTAQWPDSHADTGAPRAFGATRVTRPEWTGRQAAHEARVDRLVAAHLERRRRGEHHPVEDFLFTYYSFRPGALRRWHPGPDLVLEDVDEGSPPATRRGYVRDGGEVRLDPAYVEGRRERIEWIRDLLTATANRPASYGCLGLHEWAMVYRQPPEEVRHAAWPLRLGPEGTDAVVESHRIRCSHFDAFRFFTDAARPRNLLRPTREDQPRTEQPGCLHAGMDIHTS